MPVKPPPPRHTTEHFADKLIITIPSRRYWFKELWMWFLIAIWVFGDVFLIYMLIQAAIEGELSVFIFLMFLFAVVFFTISAVFYLRTLVPQAYGTEVIGITNQGMTISRIVLGHGTPKEYAADDVKDLRLIPSSPGLDHPMMTWMYIPGLAGSHQGIGWLAFDYGAQTFRFGSGIDEAEAKQILAEIVRNYPRYKS